MSKARIVAIVGAAVIALGGAVACGAGAATPAPTVSVGTGTRVGLSAGTAASKAASLTPSETPGGYCATVQVGKTFAKDGVTYTCGGEKPYRWQVPAKAAPTKAVSVEQENANETAASYLEGQSFSRKGLINQLKFEGFSTKVATAAVDALHPDWNEQAVSTAKDYLDGQSFSKKSLIAQLEFDGFTRTQAEYGVSKTGL